MRIMREKRSMPWKHWLIHWGRPVVKLAFKVAVPFFAIRGRYPRMMLTPDDQVSPFGSGTTDSASVEPSQIAVYAWGTKVGGAGFGRWLGDVVWLGWRNSGYGVAYYLKPGWLKEPTVRYMDLEIRDERQPPARGYFDENGDYREASPGPGTVWVKQPDGTWLWETTRKFGPVFLITGYRLSGIVAGANEDKMRVERGGTPVPRPVHHPNMDGRPLVSFRTERTMLS